MISTVITALVSFASTNIDDIFILMLFFSQVNNVMKRRDIIIGQYLGIGALTVISIVGALGVSVIPHEYVGLLGLVPIYLGIKTYVDYKKERDDSTAGEHECQDSQSHKFEDITNIQENRLITCVKSVINPSAIKVAAVTFANGGDNIGIYIPLFARMSLLGILVTLVIFILLTAVWCLAGLKLAEHPFIQKNIEKYKHIFEPIIFIGLGIFILMESGTLNFIFKLVL